MRSHEQAKNGRGDMSWEDALEKLKKISRGELKSHEKTTIKIFCYKIDPRLANRRDCKMLKHKKGKAAPYSSIGGARPYLLAEVEIEKLTENGKKFIEAKTSENRYAKYSTSVVKEDECIIPSERGNFYSYNVLEFFRTWQIPVGESGTDFINLCAERLEKEARREKKAWADRAERLKSAANKIN